MRGQLFLLALVLLRLAGAATAFAQEQTNPEAQNSVSTRVFQLALPQGHLLGDWDGLLPQLEAIGIEPTLTLVTDFAGNPSGGRYQGWTAPSSLAASVLFDLDKILGVKDASLLVTASERWGNSLSADYIGNIFAAQQIYGYQTLRLIDVSYQQKLFDDRLEIRVGRFAALDDFLVSAYSCLFMQLGFCGNPAAILFDSPGVTGYAGTWAAAAKVKPTARSYLQVGVYNGDPTIRANDRHGVDLSLGDRSSRWARSATRSTDCPATTANCSATTSWAPGTTAPGSPISAPAPRLLEAGAFMGCSIRCSCHLAAPAATAG
jgi:carbohydrate-selective porin OprB